VLLPNFPAIAQIDERLLQFFKMLGNIPLEAIIQSEQLYRSGTGVPTRMRVELRAHVRNRLELGVFNDLAEEYAHLRARFEKVTASGARYLRLPHGEHGPSPLLTECSRNFQDQCDDLYRELCRFIARGVLKSGWSRAERLRAFTEMGFDSVHEIGETLDPNQVVTLVAMLFWAILIALTLVGSQMAIQRRAQQKECADWGNWRRERHCRRPPSAAFSMGYEPHKLRWMLTGESSADCGDLYSPQPGGPLRDLRNRCSITADRKLETVGGRIGRLVGARAAVLLVQEAIGFL
jgi:hypothetical protein